MPRVRKGAARTQAREKLLKAARGYYGTNHLHKYRAKIAVLRAGVYAYRDRRARKRDMRSLWIIRITAACKMRGTRYSLFINGLKNAGIILNRKMLSNIAIQEPAVFDQLVKLAVEHSSASKPKAVAKA
jgi:large subunit ribosomal protein L20